MARRWLPESFASRAFMINLLRSIVFIFPDSDLGLLALGSFLDNHSLVFAKSRDNESLKHLTVSSIPNSRDIFDFQPSLEI